MLRAAFLCLLTACGATAGRATTADFERLLSRYAAAINRNDARQAAECFAVDAVYEEPPAKQLYRGREALFEFFGGKETVPPKMNMTWHHIVFDEQRQMGAGEYTYVGNNRYHGIVIVKLAEGVIHRWREYQTKSELPWERFVEATMF